LAQQLPAKTTTTKKKVAGLGREGDELFNGLMVQKQAMGPRHLLVGSGGEAQGRGA
jgi:hypothetical protein